MYTCRKETLLLIHRATSQEDSTDNDDSHPPPAPRLSHSDTPTPSRRSFLKAATLGIAISVTAVLGPPLPEPALARGLVEFPCNKKPLLNKYYFMRAGTTLLEEQDIWSTNPLFLTNREAALSEIGIAQVQEASRFLAQSNINPSVVKYSLAAAAMDTAQILKDSELQVGQNRLIPEFTFMDPRAIGKWDMMSLSQTQPAVFAMDASQAGLYGKEGRPPPNEDGTPHETLADQAIRLRQLMSGTCGLVMLVILLLFSVVLCFVVSFLVLLLLHDC
jgi:broad specificity phosphatase PhoE